MKARIYKSTGRLAQVAEPYTILLKLPKFLVGRVDLNHTMFCGKVEDGEFRHHVDYLPKDVKLGIDYSLGKQVKGDEVPAEVREFAAKMEKYWNLAVNFGYWNLMKCA